MILIRALVAVIHACLKAFAATVLAMTSLAITSVLLVVGFFAILGFLGFTGVGGFSIVRWRRKRRGDSEEL